MAQCNQTDGLGVIISLLIDREFKFNFEKADKEMKEVLETVNKKQKTLNVAIRRQHMQHAMNTEH